MISEHEIVMRMILSFVLGGLVGIERECHNKSAGFRTHILVCLGSTLIMIISIYGFPQAAVRDPARLAAQVVSGIGFLGAGTILKDGNDISGLTTAASLWVVSGIGLAVGAGCFLAAVSATAFSFLTLISLAQLEKRYFGRKQSCEFYMIIDERPGQIGEIGSILGQRGITIKSLETERYSKDYKKLQLHLILRLPYPLKKEEILTILADLEGVNAIELGD